MFGYIIINKPEMKFREFDLYRSYYCGLCHTLRKEYGLPGQLTLSYDMTFLILLLSGLYEPEQKDALQRCIAHPLEKQPVSTNRFTAYCADMNLLMTWYKCVDDWEDERKLSRLLYSRALQSKIRRIQANYPEKARIIEEKLRELHRLETEKSADLDAAAGCFGDLTAAIFTVQEDAWAPILHRIGFYLGKFIYILDAYEDIEKDSKQGSYNPLLPYFDKPDFQDKCGEILTMMMAECCRSFEQLPILQNVEILRNILYSGVWTRYHLVNSRRAAAKQKAGQEATQKDDKTEKEKVD